MVHGWPALERDLADIFVLQDEVTAAIVLAIQPEIVSNRISTGDAATT